AQHSGARSAGTLSRHRRRTLYGAGARTARAAAPYNAAVTLLAELVQTSERIAATPARLGKVQTLAAYLRTLEPDEIEIAVHFLSGSIPQGRIGIGYAVLEDAAAAHASSATLSLQEVNSALAEITATQGAGAAGHRRGLLRALLARAT